MECTVTGCWVGAFAHGKGLCLQCMPWPAAFHQVVGQVAYRVDGFSTDHINLLVQERMEAALDRVEDLD